MEVTVVDTFASTNFYEISAQELRHVIQSFGVKLAKADLREYDPATIFEPNSVDTVDCLARSSFSIPASFSTDACAF